VPRYDFNAEVRAMKTARGCLPKTLSLILLTSILCGQGLPVFGDGKFFVWRNEKADIFQPTQKGVIYWDGREEKLILQTKYEGPAEEMVWVVPVPSEPTVKKGDPEIFEEMSKRTQEPDISYTRFLKLQTAGMRGSASPLQWQRRIGAYDVAVLSPVGTTQVIEWLKANDYGVPNEAVPILQDYIEQKWWMVAARIHRDALNAATRGQLAKGTLHPLEMTFRTTRCVYPLRLTSLAAGPVEVLLYIEGPDHYEPTTLAGPQWEMNLYGGPRRRVPIERYRRMRDWKRTYAIIEGQTELISDTCLTKLRRTFRPEQMADDIEFGKTDYAMFAASTDPRSVAEAATQYGRHREPEGIPHLLRVLSAKALSEEDHVRCCIWALGEIAIVSEEQRAIEQSLLTCAERGSSLVRMEAYIALAKARSERLGVQMVRQLGPITGRDMERFYEGAGWHHDPEMELITEWLDARATGSVKDEYVRIVSDLLIQTKRRIQKLLGTGADVRPDSLIDDPQKWVVKRAASLQDPRLVGALSAIREALPSTVERASDGREMDQLKAFLLAAEAACGSEEAVEACARLIVEKEEEALEASARLIVEKESELLDMGRGEKGYAFLDDVHRFSRRESLRTRILRVGDNDFPGFNDIDPEPIGSDGGTWRIPTRAQDAVFRRALGDKDLNDWYALYLLSWIGDPDRGDAERLHAIWIAPSDSPEEMIGKRVTAVDVLYSWGDVDRLLQILGGTEDEAVRAEALWALAEFRAPEVAPYIEKEIREKWDPAIAAANAFPTSRAFELPYHEGNVETDIIGDVRVAWAIWKYLFQFDWRREYGGDVLLKRLCSDRTLHPGLRFALLSKSPWKDPWKKPLIEGLFHELVDTALSEELYTRLVRALGQAKSTDLLLSLFEEAEQPWKQDAIFSGLLWTKDERVLPVLEKMVREVWYERFRNSAEDVEKAMDRVSLFFLDNSEPYASKARAFFLEFLRDESVDAAYRAYIALETPHGFITTVVPAMQALRNHDLPESLEKRLRGKIMEKY